MPEKNLVLYASPGEKGRKKKVKIVQYPGRGEGRKGGRKRRKEINKVYSSMDEETAARLAVRGGMLQAVRP